MPVRDISRWAGRTLPRNWGQMAKEPTTWATLFDEDALTVKPREVKVTDLIKSYRYATRNFGAAVAIRHTHLARDLELDGLPSDVAWSQAAQEVIQDFYAESNDERAKEFACEFRTDDALSLLQRYAAAKKVAVLAQDVQEGPPG